MILKYLIYEFMVEHYILCGLHFPTVLCVWQADARTHQTTKVELMRTKRLHDGRQCCSARRAFCVPSKTVSIWQPSFAHSSGVFLEVFALICVCRCASQDWKWKCGLSSSVQAYLMPYLSCMLTFCLPFVVPMLAHIVRANAEMYMTGTEHICMLWPFSVFAIERVYFIYWLEWGNVRRNMGYTCRLLAFGIRRIDLHPECQQIREEEDTRNRIKEDDSPENDVSQVMVTVARAIWIWKAKKGKKTYEHRASIMRRMENSSQRWLWRYAFRLWNTKFADGSRKP